ncbi:MrcB family domain-containing protein [Phyllobacterium chamaecytisi]|uniref:MrcB family domain-containing protein n=1 Tax=Phyllobacterium chamaecytisi TaxID=2876082 RepID=UPI001CCEA578|nr:DUF3578 domain-containing protein [Phyllobacterium sp. KW56]MBZ9602230.1 DUF3578 domain-containing protein [Phyllobacterium sp. KW56]
MGIRSTLRRIGSEYPSATRESFTAHLLAKWIRTSAPQEINKSVGDSSIGLIVQGSAGAGNWAEVPWIAYFEPSASSGATGGYYLVYLFSASGAKVHLSLNQGTTNVREEFKSAARDVLRERASFVRRRIRDFIPALPDIEIDLETDRRLPADYVAGHALGITYTVQNLPDEATLIRDLRTAMDAYRALVFRGGMSMGEMQQNLGGQRALPIAITEQRKYRMHYAIERNPKAATVAKAHHGYICQACGFDFQDIYGALGVNFIEAHHLRPISSLDEGSAVDYNVADDFAVLCANCHRMIHRLSDPSDLPELVSRIKHLR